MRIFYWASLLNACMSRGVPGTAIAEARLLSNGSCKNRIGGRAEGEGETHLKPSESINAPQQEGRGTTGLGARYGD